MIDRRPGTTEGLLPEGTTIALSRTFDDHLRVESETVNGSTVGFGYDKDGVLKTAGDLTITRDPDHGLVTGTTLASGGHTITDSLVPTPFGEPDLYTVVRDGVELFRIDYAPFDRHGQLRTKTETIQGGTPTRRRWNCGSSGLWPGAKRRRWAEVRERDAPSSPAPFPRDRPDLGGKERLS